jgi:hypothetical protein
MPHRAVFNRILGEELLYFAAMVIFEPEGASVHRRRAIELGDELKPCEGWRCDMAEYDVENVIGGCFKYHRPSCLCTARIYKCNWQVFRSYKEAVAARLKPCGVCKPDRVAWEKSVIPIPPHHHVQTSSAVQHDDSHRRMIPTRTSRLTMRIVALINAGGDSIELMFPSVPPKETLSELKDAGFRWNKQRKTWRAGRSAITFRLTEKLTSMHDLAERAKEYEKGEMSNEDAIKFFQHLIDSGAAWTMTGHYGRVANLLIAAGRCHLKK